MELVTGAASFLGSAVAHLLVEGGSRARAAVFPGESLPPHLSRRGVEQVELPVSDPALAQAALSGISVIYHCANIPPGPDYGENLEITGQFLKAARALDIRVVYPSTVHVYGHPRDSQVAEEYPLAPTRQSGLLKQRIEGLLRAMGGRWSVFRLPALLGSGVQVYATRYPYDTLVAGDEVIVPGDGEALTELLHVQDAARALVLGGRHPAADGQVFNVPGHVLKVREYYQLLANTAGAPDKLVRRPLETLPARLQEELSFLTFSLTVDGRKIQRELGFEPQVPLVEAIRETLAWARAEAERGAPRVPSVAPSPGGG
jgi:nucleoside-diphosphate-sugar epimerase